MDKRLEKRWRRENRQNKGRKAVAPSCRKCGHELTRFGCPNCEPNIGSVGLGMLNGGLVGGAEMALFDAIASRRIRRLY